MPSYLFSISQYLGTKQQMKSQSLFSLVSWERSLLVDVNGDNKQELLISDVENITSPEESMKEDLRDLILEMKKERVKSTDERIQNNDYVRRISREETIIEIAKDAAIKISQSNPVAMTPLEIVENTDTSNLNSYRIEIENEELNKKLKEFYEKVLSN